MTNHAKKKRENSKIRYFAHLVRTLITLDEMKWELIVSKIMGDFFKFFVAFSEYLTRKTVKSRKSKLTIFLF